MKKPAIHNFFKIQQPQVLTKALFTYIYGATSLISVDLWPVFEGYVIVTLFFHSLKVINFLSIPTIM